ncbi:hypothetical protein CR513_12507, partial [Mucuna pruriens]
MEVEDVEDHYDPALVNLRQEEDESLRSFMERFTTVAIKIKDLSPKVTLHSMIMVLKPELFSNSLCKKPLASMDELRARAFGYIQMKEMSRALSGEKLEVGMKGDVEATYG